MDSNTNSFSNYGGKKTRVEKIEKNRIEVELSLKIW